jgi:selenocysteine-specific elongation factor
MRVIGTAGHVDHGKSALIEALTGTHPDRLKEEQVRQMTIELGFGWLTLPDGQEVGIVDVPGHRDFIENMLAGVAGIDAVLLVVAVDEGVMPQTREHIAILDLLQVRGGVIVLTKTDLISDRDWLEAVETDIKAAVKGTVLQGAPIVRVSARTRSGLDSLKATLGEVLTTEADRPDLERPRLPIDRVFSMSGFGTVVTGTLSDGSFRIGDEVQLLPSGLSGRIRGLQTHRKKVERAVPGSRTAVNISGLSADQIGRGEVLIHPGQYQSTRRIDAQLRLLGTASSPLLHNREVKVFAGTSETTAVIRLLGTEELSPGEEGWIQLELRNPLVCVRGDAFILRRPSPGETLGGGRVADPQPGGRHKRFDVELLEALDALAQGAPDDVLFEAALALGAAPIHDLVARSHLTPAAARSAITKLIQDGRLILLERGETTAEADVLAMALPAWRTLEDRATRMVAAYHSKYPLRPGIPREELKSRLDLPVRLFNGMIQQMSSENAVLEKGHSLALATHEIRYDLQQRSQIERLMRRFAESPYGPPSLKECQDMVGEEIVGALIGADQLIAVSSEVLFRKEDYDSMVSRIRAVLDDKGEITLAEARDLFHTSRKFAQALLEHLDATGITKRTGDSRVLMH